MESSINPHRYRCVESSNNPLRGIWNLPVQLLPASYEISEISDFINFCLRFRDDFVIVERVHESEVGSILGIRVNLVSGRIASFKKALELHANLSCWIWQDGFSFRIIFPVQIHPRDEAFLQLFVQVAVRLVDPRKFWSQPVQETGKVSSGSLPSLDVRFCFRSNLNVPNKTSQ